MSGRDNGKIPSLPSPGGRELKGAVNLSEADGRGFKRVLSPVTGREFKWSIFPVV